MMLDEEVEQRVCSIFLDDDVEDFKKYLSEEKTPGVPVVELLKFCLLHNAKKCALCLLKSDYPGSNGRPVSIGTDKYILIEALGGFPDPEVIGLLIDTCSCQDLVNQIGGGYLPIHEILTNIGEKWPVTQWSQGDSLVKLIIVLCNPKLKSLLETAKIIAQHTEALSEVVTGFVYNGDIKELAALLLVAHDRVLPSAKSSPLSTDPSWYTDPTNTDAKVLVSRAIRSKLPNPTALALLQIFDKAGDKLSDFYRSTDDNVSPREVICKVATIVHEAGIELTFEDIDVSLIYGSFYKKHCLESLRAALGISLGDSIDMSHKPVFRSASSYRSKAPPEYMKDYMFWQGLNQRDFDAKAYNSQGVRNYSSGAIRATCSRQSSRGVAFLAMKLGRRIRFL